MTWAGWQASQGSSGHGATKDVHHKTSSSQRGLVRNGHRCHRLVQVKGAASLVAAHSWAILQNLRPESHAPHCASARPCSHSSLPLEGIHRPHPVGRKAHVDERRADDHLHHRVRDRNQRVGVVANMECRADLSIPLHTGGGRRGRSARMHRRIDKP